MLTPEAARPRLALTRADIRADARHALLVESSPSANREQAMPAKRATTDVRQMKRAASDTSAVRDTAEPRACIYRLLVCRAIAMIILMV